LIQATNAAPPDASLEVTKKAMVEKHVEYIGQATAAGAQIVCLQEIFYGLYFCAEQTTRWYDFTEPAHAVANGYFVGAINRVGMEAPWNIGEFYGSSYFCDPRGRIVAQASRDKDEVLTAILTWT
jgi:predicted amidohydrolase